MSKALLKNTFLNNWKLLLTFFVVFCLYLSVIVSLIDPNDIQKIKEIFSAMGDFMNGMLAIFGISVDAMTNPMAYTASVFFGILVMGFTMVFYILLVIKLVAKQVDNNSLSYTLSMPISRTKFILTQAFYLFGSLLILFLGILMTGSIALGIVGDFDFSKYINLVAVTFLLNLFMAMLSFLLSVAFCDSNKGVGLAAGIPIAFLILNMLGGVSDKTKWLSKVSPFGWIDAVGIANGTVNTWWMYLAFIMAVAVLLIVTVMIFKKKRLPL